VLVDWKILEGVVGLFYW